jgi:hypothetical protein
MHIFEDLKLRKEEERRREESQLYIHGWYHVTWSGDSGMAAWQLELSHAKQVYKDRERGV